jgi:transposase
VPVLIDSTGIQNDINTHFTAVSNHNSDINNELRVVYVVDKNTKIPIFFKNISGNIIDNSILINTINELYALDVNIELLIVDAGYSSNNNISELLKINIPFLTRLPKNRLEHKTLFAEYDSALMMGENAEKYGDRLLYGVKAKILIHNIEVFAYIMRNMDVFISEQKHILDKYDNSNIKNDIINEKILKAGKFILISTSDLPVKEILPLYYQRQIIDQLFDIAKTYANMDVIRAYKDHTIKGILLISFFSSILYTIINEKLTDKKFCGLSAIIKLRYLQIKIYEKMNIIEEMTNDHKQIFNYLKLELPFRLEDNNFLHKDSYLTSLRDKKAKKGRPKGRTTRKKADLESSVAHSSREASQGLTTPTPGSPA